MDNVSFRQKNANAIFFLLQLERRAVLLRMVQLTGQYFFPETPNWQKYFITWFAMIFLKKTLNNMLSENVLKVFLINIYLIPQHFHISRYSFHFVSS